MLGRWKGVVSGLDNSSRLGRDGACVIVTVQRNIMWTPPTRVRRRKDCRWIAIGKTLGHDKGKWEDQEEYERTPPAQAGDIWTVRWYGTGTLAGYDICCPGCLNLHSWTSAHNCSGRMTTAEGRVTCVHQINHTSCWIWTGSPILGNVSASPSLHCSSELGGCGWHGFLRNDIMTSV